MSSIYIRLRNSLLFIHLIHISFTSAWYFRRFQRAWGQGTIGNNIDRWYHPPRYPKGCTTIRYESRRKDADGNRAKLGFLTGLTIQQKPPSEHVDREIDRTPLSMLAFYAYGNSCNGNDAVLIARYWDRITGYQQLEFDEPEFSHDGYGEPQEYRCWKEIGKDTDEWKMYVEGWQMQEGDVLWRETHFEPFLKRENMIDVFGYGEDLKEEEEGDKIIPEPGSENGDGNGNVPPGYDGIMEVER